MCASQSSNERFIHMWNGSKILNFLSLVMNRRIAFFSPSCQFKEALLSWKLLKHQCRIFSNIQMVASTAIFKNVKKTALDWVPCTAHLLQFFSSIAVQVADALAHVLLRLGSFSDLVLILMSAIEDSLRVCNTHLWLCVQNYVFPVHDRPYIYSFTNARVIICAYCVGE